VQVSYFNVVTARELGLWPVCLYMFCVPAATPAWRHKASDNYMVEEGWRWHHQHKIKGVTGLEKGSGMFWTHIQYSMPWGQKQTRQTVQPGLCVCVCSVFLLPRLHYVIAHSCSICTVLTLHVRITCIVLRHFWHVCAHSTTASLAAATFSYATVHHVSDMISTGM
jgi:hypothetical protein